MKTSPTSWVLPQHWIQTRLSRDVTISGGQVDPTQQPWSSMVLIAPNHIESGTGVVLDLETAQEQGADSGKYLARAGQVLYSKIRPALNKVTIAPIDCLCSADMYAISGRLGIVDNRFLMYWMLARPFGMYAKLMADRVKMPKINREEVSAAPWARPPFEEQRAIVRFLDRETAQIDALINKQNELIERLRERRAAVADRLVWSGVASDAQQGPTGVAPAPTAPSHWQRVRNKNLFAERSEVSGTGDEELLTVSHITGVTPRSEKNVTMFEAESLKGYRIVHAGDLAINTMWAWMGALGVSTYDGIVSPAYGVYAPQSRVPYLGRYFDYLYRSSPYVAEMTRHSRGIRASRLRLYPDAFLRLPVVVPPREEQEQIVAQLDGQTAKIDILIAKAQEHIDLAKERRRELITEAVTGQIDVTERGTA